jgi:hypothetical protein
MNLLNALTTYSQKWKETSRGKLSEQDIKSVESATVKNSVEFPDNYSVCLFMKGGGEKYIPLSRDTNAEIGDDVNLEDMEILTLSRSGDKDIFRAEF